MASDSAQTVDARALVTNSLAEAGRFVSVTIPVASVAAVEGVRFLFFLAEQPAGASAEPNQIDAAKPFANPDFIATTMEDIPRLIFQAVAAANSGRLGKCYWYLDIPSDLLNQTLPGSEAAALVAATAADASQEEKAQMVKKVPLFYIMGWYRFMTRKGIQKHQVMAVATADTGEDTMAVMKAVSHVIKSVPAKRGFRLVILYQVGDSFVEDLACKIEVKPKNLTTLRRVHARLIRESGRAKINLKNLHRLYNFPGWGWVDVQEKLHNITKNKVSVLIYRERREGLRRCAADLKITYLCLTGNTESDDILHQHVPGLTVKQATDLLRHHQNTHPARQTYN